MKKYFLHLVSIMTVTFFLLLAFGSLDDESSNEKDSEIKKVEYEEGLSEAQLDSLKEYQKTQMIDEREKSTITSVNLVNVYENNEVKADNSLKGYNIYVEGYIEDIGKDILDEIYITLKGPDNSFRSVQCYIDDANVVGNLSKGQFVTVYGKCKGLMMNVLIYDCVIVQNLSDLKKN